MAIRLLTPLIIATLFLILASVAIAATCSESYNFNASTEDFSFSAGVGNVSGSNPGNLRLDSNVGSQSWSGWWEITFATSQTVSTNDWFAVDITKNTSADCGNFSILFEDGSFQSSTGYGACGSQPPARITMTVEAGNNGKFISGWRFYAEGGPSGPASGYWEWDNAEYFLANCTTELTCPLVPNFHFDNDDDWLLAGTASITNSYLYLPPGDSAAQNLSTLNSNTSYNAVVSIITPTTALNVVLGLETQTISGSAGVYTLTFATETLGGPVIFGFENNDDTTTIIDYACLSLASSGSGGQAQLDCIAPPNGNFNTPADWNYQNNAAYNGTTKAAFIPYNDPTQSGPFYTPAFIETSNYFTLPAIAGDEFLILQFNAQSVNGQNALLTSLTGNEAQTIDQEFIFEVYPQSYNFQADVSILAEESTALLFGNNGNYPDDPAYVENINLDDVCIFVSDTGPTLPTPTDPNAIDPVDLGAFYSCADVAGFMVNWGVDMRYHQANYLDTPGLWDAADWVPWLISALFVGVEMGLCAFVVFLQSVLNIVEYAINNGLNFAHWGRINAILAIPWLIDHYESGYFSFDNFSDFLRATAASWLTWLQLSLTEFGDTLPQIVSNLATLSLWLGYGFIWVASIFGPLLLWFLPEASNMVRTILNFLIDNGWNGFLDGLSLALSEVLDLLAYVWNQGLLPALYGLIGLLVPGFGVFFFFATFWALAWSIVQYVWANVFEAINIPFAFYIGLNEGVNSPAFSNLAGCDGTTSNFWCGVFAALDLLNIVAGASIFYPIVIVGITIGTIVILYRNMLAVWEFYADWLSRI